jgi:[ribosomal protein S5]-alanine N-acetyltransferase
MTSSELRALRACFRRLRDPVVRTRRLDLVLPGRSRFRELAALIDDPRIARWTLHIPRPYRLRHALEFGRRAARGRRAASDLALLVVRRSDGRLVGGIGLHHLDADNARGELGYWVGRPYRGQGYAREATSALADFAFGRLRLHRLWAGVFPGNEASVRVLRATGFRREGHLRESLAKDGTFRDELLFGRLAPGRGRPRARATSRVRRSRPTQRRRRA